MPRLSISAYTTSYNCLEMEYPIEQCIESLLGFCQEVCVADAGSTDGTLELLERLAKQESRLRFQVHAVDFGHPRWAIHQDGYLKAKARAMCKGDYCWQIDNDEVVPAEDYTKIERLPEIMGDYALMMLPMVEFWGGFDCMRGDFFSWKPRFSRNDPRITHGIPKALKLFDAQGHEYPKPFDSDSCNYIWRDTETDVPVLIPTSHSFEQLQKLNDADYEKWFASMLDLFPCVQHVSWLNLERKIWHYKQYWPKFHASMYNLSTEDTAQNNVMFEKPWGQVTGMDIKALAEELKRIGPRSFHHKIDRAKKGPVYFYNRPVADRLKRWAAEHAVPRLAKQESSLHPGVNVDAAQPLLKPVTTIHAAEQPAGAATIKRAEIDFITHVRGENPLVSAIIPTYNKAPYLPESIGSVAEQSYPNIELIVVNDGSTDNSSGVVMELARKYPHRRINLIEKPNGGISDARNAGIRRAQGRIILTVDGDDIVESSFVAKALDAMRNLGANLVTCNVALFGEKSGEWVPNPYDKFYIRYDNSIPTLTMYDRALWETTGGYKLAFPIVEDWEFFINCSRHGLKVHRLEERLFRYRCLSGGLASIFENSYREVLSLVMCADEDLYAVDEVLVSHNHLITAMPERFVKRFELQATMHSKEWLLKLWLGLNAEGRGQREIAMQNYIAAINLSECKNWQPIFRLGFLMYQLGRLKESVEMIHLARTLRPDLCRIANDLVKDIEGRIKQGEGAGR